MTKDFVFTTKASNQIRVSTYGFDNLKTSPCVIFVHGFKGFKDWGFWPETGKKFAENGFFVLSFNFSHNGVGENPTEFTEPDKFAQNTFSLEVSELNEIIDGYSQNFFGKINNNRIGLLGHSRGGAVSLLSAARNHEIYAVAVWAPVAKLDRYSDRQKKQWKKEGFFEVVNSRTKQVMRLNVSFLEDIEKNSAGSLNLRKAVSELRKPLMIAHGEQDLTVKIEESELIYEWSDKNLTTLYRIKTAGHTFGIEHPFTESNPDYENILNKTINFFKSNLLEDQYAGN